MEVRATEAVLRRTSGSAKEYKVDLLWFGEKARNGTNVHADHYFPSRSPAEFLPANTAKRVVYMGAILEYQQAIQTALVAATNEAIGLRSLVERAQSEGIVPQELESRFGRIEDALISSIMQSIQMETGRYSLSIAIKYRRVGLWSRDRKSTSSIEFDFPNDTRTRIEAQVRELAKRYVANSARPDSKVLYEYPQYAPVNITERG